MGSAFRAIDQSPTRNASVTENRRLSDDHAAAAARTGLPESPRLIAASAVGLIRLILQRHRVEQLTPKRNGLDTTAAQTLKCGARGRWAFLTRAPRSSDLL